MNGHDYQLTIGTECVTLRKRGESRLRVGNLLAREVTDGVEFVYVDRLLVAPGSVDLSDGWTASGCISTILTRTLEQPAAPPVAVT